MTWQRKAELIGAAVILIAAFVFLVGYIRERERIAAFEAETKVREQLQADAKKEIEQIRASMQAQIDALARQKQQVISQPQLAPQVIKEYVPFTSPLQQTQEITKQAPPDAPSAILTKQQEVELAQFALNCKQCDVERDGLNSQMAEKDKIIASQAEELKQAKTVIKGGTKKQRFIRTLEALAIGGAIGYAAHR